MSQIINKIRPRLGAALIHMDIFERIGYISARSLTTAPVPKEEVKTPKRLDEKPKGPIKFTTSQAYLNYRSSDNFYGGDDRDLPKSHNLVIAGTGMAGVYYLIFARDDIEADGGKGLFMPLHETVPDLAIPLIQAAIAENKKFGYTTHKLEKKLAELLEESEKKGPVRKLVEN